MLFVLMLSILLIKKNVGLSGKSVELEYVIIYFSMPKRGCAIITEGAIFGGNTLFVFVTGSSYKCRPKGVEYYDSTGLNF